MRSQTQKSTKYTPFFLMFRWEVRVPHHMEFVDRPVDVASIDAHQSPSGVHDFINATAPIIKEVDQKVSF